MGFPTYFKILSNYFPLTYLESGTFNINDNVKLNPKVSKNDKTTLLQSYVIMYIFRSSLILDNLILATQYVTGYLDLISFFPIQLLDKKVSILNSVTQHEGRLLSTNHPMDLHLENTTFDFYKSQEGLYLNYSCNYPGINSKPYTYLKSVKFYYSKGNF